MVTLKYLLDTNVLSEPARPRPNPALVKGAYDEQAAEWHARERARLESKVARSRFATHRSRR